MPKYDDFGRPIYETAEEYNRAHGRGGSSYTYDRPKEDTFRQNVMGQGTRNQTAAQRHAMREGSKKAKTVVIAIVAFAIALNVALIFSMGDMVGSAVAEPEIGYSNVIIENEDYYGEYLGEGDIPLPEGYENFTYDGIWITLPTTCKEIAELGYQIQEYELTDNIPPGFWETLSLVDENGYTVALFSVENDTEYDISLAECVVDYFYVDNITQYDETLELPNFIYGNGLTLESSYEEIEEYFGEPYYHYEDHSDEEYRYDSYEWTYYVEDEMQFVMITFVNDEISDICIQKEVY